MKKFDARLGVYAIDTGTNQTIAYRPNKGLPLHQNKALAAGALLQQNSTKKLDEVMLYHERRLSGLFTCYRETCRYWNDTRKIAEAAVRYSDNTAGTFYFIK